jgi:hypothetical protein
MELQNDHIKSYKYVEMRKDNDSTYDVKEASREVGDGVLWKKMSARSAGSRE